MQYIMLIRLTPEGLDQVRADPRSPLEVEAAIAVAGVSALGIYGVLGPYDYVALLEAGDNDAAARWSVEFGARMRAEVTTMPAVPISHFDEPTAAATTAAASPGIGRIEEVD